MAERTKSLIWGALGAGVLWVALNVGQHLYQDHLLLHAVVSALNQAGPPRGQAPASEASK